MTERIQAEFAEISTLSQQIVTDDDKDDEAIIARADQIHLDVKRKANTLSWPVKKMNERPTR